MGRKRFEVCPKCGKKGYGSSDSLYSIGRLVSRCIYCRYTDLTHKELFHQFHTQIEDLQRALAVAKSVKAGRIYKVTTTFNIEVTILVDVLDYPGFSGKALTSKKYILKSDDSFYVTYSDVTKLEEITVKDLPLFIGDMYKTNLYEKLLKGETIK
jgi:hypothetical protein